MGKRAFFVAKSGSVCVPVYRCRQLKAGHKYIYFSVIDHSTGQRKQKTFADSEKAKDAARSLAKAQAAGEGDRVTLAGRELRNALDALRPHELKLDRACQILVDALAFCPPSEFVEAARFWKQSRPSGPFTPKGTKEAVASYLGTRKGKVSGRRYSSEVDLLGQFSGQFGGRNLHEVGTVEIEDFAGGRPWGAARRNDFFKVLSRLYSEAVRRGWACVNPADAKVLKRDRIKAGDVLVFTVDQGRKLLNGVEDSLKPFAALLCLSGLRKEEAAKVTWSQIGAALESESSTLYLPASQAKTGVARNIEICPALREWLMRYRQPGGPVLPVRYSASAKGIDRVATDMARQAGVEWSQNVPRHSFASYHVALHKDAPRTTAQMGNSLAMLQRHYWARAAGITTAQAQAWFDMRPGAAEIIQMPVAATV